MTLKEAALATMDAKPRSNDANASIWWSRFHRLVYLVLALLALSSSVAQASSSFQLSAEHSPEMGALNALATPFSSRVGIVRAVTLTTAERSWRIRLEVSSHGIPSLKHSERPNALIIELEKTFSPASALAQMELGFTRPAIQHQTLAQIADALSPQAAKQAITGMGIFNTSKDSTRLTFDTSRQMRILTAAIIPQRPGEFLVNIEITDTSEGAQPASAEASSLAAGHAQLVIVIDPGHGGHDVGAVGRSGLFEKDVTLDFALALQRNLTSRSNYNVIMTRSDDRFVSLNKRLQIAQNAGANLMISIHADALTDRTVRGASVYTFSLRPSDEPARRAARRENGREASAAPNATDPLEDVFASLIMREKKALSEQFAGSLLAYLGHVGGLHKSPRRSANFAVLRAPDVPAVLLELGYLSNERDAALMIDPSWLERRAELAAQAIDAMFQIGEQFAGASSDRVHNKGR
jgi:N-acetylmuramoyl-L-alanine amidase